MVSDKGLATLLLHLHQQQQQQQQQKGGGERGGKEGGKEGGREVWLQLRREYAVLLLWRKTKEERREEGREGGRVRLFIFRPGVIRDWDQRKEAKEAAKEEERRAREEVVVREGGREGGEEEGGEVVVAGWGVRVVPMSRKVEEGKEGGKEGNSNKSSNNLNGTSSHPNEEKDEEEDEEEEGGEDDAALLHLATHGAFTHPLVLPPCLKCHGPSLIGFYQHERRKGNGGYRELGKFVQALPLRVRRSLPLVTPFCPRCEGGREEGREEGVVAGERKERWVQVSYRFLDGCSAGGGGREGGSGSSDRLAASGGSGDEMGGGR
jgi:hypothetical protein